MKTEKNIGSKINSYIKRNEPTVNFTALLVAIVALIIALIAFYTTSTVYIIPKPIIDFCPTIRGAGSFCDSIDIRNTCGEEKKVFTLSCGGDSEHFQIISNIYNKGSALATNIQMEIQFENNTLFTDDNLIDLYENGVNEKSTIGCKPDCRIRVIWMNVIPILKAGDTYEFKVTFNRSDFKEKEPKYVKFILYQDGKEKIEKIININYK